MQIARSGLFSGVNPTLALIAKVLVILGALAGAFLLDADSAAMSFLREHVINALKVYYIPLVAFFLVFVIGLLFTRYGNVRLGDDSERPEFNNFTWFAMLFSCGMGIGLVFWSIAEPIYHFQGNPFISEQQAQTEQAATVAMRLTFFHWGLHPWAIYVIVGLSMAYFSYRKKLPLTIRSALYPLIGDRVNGAAGHIVDVIAIFATVFGVATSLGLGVQQLNEGLSQLIGITVSTGMQIALVIGITGLATVSVVSGLGRGIKYLSLANVLLSILILMLILTLGPTERLLTAMAHNTGDYFAHVLPLSLWFDPDPQGQWQDWWTTFYWAWWIAWAPFVGMFIARISRGRTIREFVTGVMLIPTAVGFLWLTIFGNTGLDIELNGAGGVVEAVSQDVTKALYSTFQLMDAGNMAGVLAVLATILIATYFITSSDSGTLVVTTILAGGNPHPPTQQRLIWGIGEGAVAAVLLLGGGLQPLQIASISAALPFSLVMLVMIYGLIKALLQEKVGPQYGKVSSTARPAGTDLLTRAQNGDVRAQVRLGQQLVRDKSEQEAFKWFERAASQGSMTAKSNLGIMYLRGKGVSRNPEEGTKLISEAAHKGHAEAQANLGWIYERGQGVAADVNEAMRWYKQAADQGVARAREALLRLNPA